MKPITLSLTCFLIALNFSSFGQSVIIPKEINLPADSAIKNQLIGSLNGFLAQKEKPNKDNKYVRNEDLLIMSALLDEMKGMEKNAAQKDDNYYKCYLDNVVNIGDGKFVVQFSYKAITGNIPVVRASFRLLAKNQDGQFYFYSPLHQNTLSWKTKKIGNINYHYKDTLNTVDAKEYLKAVNSYDKRLKAPFLPIEFYYCDDFPEVQQVLGMDYKLEYNGIRYNNITSRENNSNLAINGWNAEKHRFDAHDLWHERLRNVMDATIINRPVDEGCAYLYGGSWGISWPDILTMFKKYAADNPNADWLQLYTDTKTFADGGKPLRTAYVINALIVQKIEKEKGFAPVMELLGCGKREKGDDNYFKALEKITGITKANFNSEVWKLISGAK